MEWKPFKDMLTFNFGPAKTLVGHLHKCIAANKAGYFQSFWNNLSLLSLGLNIGFAFCGARLQAGIYANLRCPPEDRRYKIPSIAQLRAALSRLIDRRGARRAAVLHTRPRGDDLAALADLVAEGRLRPAIDRIYPLEEVREAHAASQAGHPMGKIVLRIDAQASPGSPA